MNPPPFLVSFSSADNFLKALPKELHRLYAKDFNLLYEKKFPPVVSIRCLSLLFGYSSKFTGTLYRFSEKYYRTFKIPKGTKYRVINAPRVSLKVIQKWFGFHLSEAMSFESCVFGFIKGQSTVKAAKQHCGADWIYSVDIENFFPSITLTQVIKSLVSLGYPVHGAELIAKLCCFDGGLAQGSPASPVLSNLVFKDSDAELLLIAQKHNLCFTRYADDIVFSGKSEFPEEIKSMIQKVLDREGWKISKNKEWFARTPNRLKVHGLLVHRNKPRLTKGYRNKIRAYKHLLLKDAIKESDHAKILGHLSYAKSVDGEGL